jgi:hypothetical protein
LQIRNFVGTPTGLVLCLNSHGVKNDGDGEKRKMVGVMGVMWVAFMEVVMAVKENGEGWVHG